MNVVREDVEKLIEKELEEAIKLHGLNHSLHEKYAVTLEEVEEAQYEMKQCAEWLHTAWENIKDDDTENAIRDFQGLYSTAVRLICESIQVAAMAKKEVDREVGNGTAEISDHGGYSGKDPVRVFFCDACRKDFVSGNRPHPRFCPECGAEFTNVLRF